MAHQYVLSAGHRNTDRGGAVREFDWTYPISKKLQAEIQRRGGKAWVIQEEDGDNDPTFCVGRGLQNAAALCVSLARTVGGANAYISMHYEGGPARGFFGIFPDGANDTRAMNPLDERLCAVIAKHVEKTGMPKRTAGVVQPGVMSERQTGVGAQGYRLGEFVGTLGFRTTTARVILEGGNYVNLTDRALLGDPAWQQKYVSAICDALGEVFGAWPNTKPDPTPTPKPDPAKKTFTMRFDLPLRDAPGWGGKVTANLKTGTTGTVLEGPKAVDGMNWFNVSIPGIGTGWVPQGILWAIAIS